MQVTASRLLTGAIGFFAFWAISQLESSQVWATDRDSLYFASSVFEGRRGKDGAIIALNKLNKRIKTDPADIRARTARATILFYLRKHKEAIPDLRYLLKRNNKDETARYLLVICLLESGFAPAAKAELDIFLRHNPSDPEGLYLRATVLRALGKDQESAADEQAAEKLGYTSRALSFIHRAEGLQTQLRKVDFAQAIAQEPSCSILYLLRAKAELAQYDYKEAIADLKKCLALNKSGDKVSCFAYLYLADASNGTGQFAEAIKYATLSIDAFERHMRNSLWFPYCLQGSASQSKRRAYELRAIAYSGLQKYTEAIRDMQQVVEEKPGVKALERLSALCNQSGKYKMALDYCGKGRGNDPRLQAERVHAYIGLKQHKEAIAAVNELLSTNPDDDVLLADRGTELFLDGQYQKAIDDLSEVIRGKDNVASIRYLKLRAQAYRKLGKENLAAADEKRILELAK